MTEQLIFRLGETAADLLADPDSYDRRARLAEAVEAYDQWRFERLISGDGMDSVAEELLRSAFCPDDTTETTNKETR